MTSSKSLQIGLICTETIPVYNIRSLKRIVDDGHSIGEIFIVDNSFREDYNKNERFFSKIRNTWHSSRWWILVSGQNWLARKLTGNSKRDDLVQTRSIDSVSFLNDTNRTHVELQPVSNQSGPWKRMPKDAVSTFRRVDVGLNFVGDLLTGDMLDAPKYGILSFHPADLRQYRGLGPSIAYRDGVEETVVTVQRLENNIDSGLVVTENPVPVSDCATLDELWGRILSSYPEAVSDALTNISDPKFEPAKINNPGEYYPRKLKRTFLFAARVALKDLIGRTVFALRK